MSAADAAHLKQLLQGQEKRRKQSSSNGPHREVLPSNSSSYFVQARALWPVESLCCALVDGVCAKTIALSVCGARVLQNAA